MSNYAGQGRPPTGEDQGWGQQPHQQPQGQYQLAEQPVQPYRADPYPAIPARGPRPRRRGSAAAVVMAIGIVLTFVVAAIAMFLMFSV